MASDFGCAGPDETKPHCKSCEKDNQFPPQTEVSPWSCTYDALGQGAANGCPRCRFVAACITTIEEYLKNDKISKVHAYPWLTRLNEFYLETERGEFYLDVFIEDEETGNLHTPFEIRKVHRRLPECTDSATTKETMRGWLSECTKSHTRCQIQRKHGNEFRGPLRLLELNKDSIVLRENAGDVQYACLSHCWGGNLTDTINKTTEQTLESFKEGITERNLTANFRDAIDVCRALDIQYLWIDSLCIIQDQESKADWNNQAAKMADIYENAHVTIAATRSADSSGGCYSTRNAKYLAKSVPGYEGVFALLEPPGLPVDLKESVIPLNLPLLERGWVYQEMRLSRRVLHFCDEQVVWICQTSRRSESKCNDGEIDDLIDSMAKSYKFIPHSLPSRDPKLLWYRWVHEYSRLQLTCPNKDRMAALAGLAKRMQNFHKMGRYLSGMWETSLIFDLGWLTLLRPNANSEKISAKDLVTAPSYPSWSWASVKSPVHWDFDASTLQPLAKLKQINCVADGPVHMGSLKPSASITIQAPAIKDSYLSQAPIKKTALTESKDLRILAYWPDRKVQEHQAETRGLLLVVTRRPGRCGVAQAVHVKLRSDSETYERVGFVFLEFDAGDEEIEKDEGEEDEEYDSDSSLWDRKPWNAFPLMEVTLV